MSFSFDVSGMMTAAGQLFQELSGVVVLVGGISLGLTVLVMFINLIRPLFGPDGRMRPWR